MDDAGLVRHLEGGGDLPTESARLLEAESAHPREARRQILALDQLHGQEADRPAVDLGLAQSEQRRDPRMADRGERSGFAFESRQAVGIGSELGRQQLDRHFAPELSVAGSIDDAHASLAERGDSSY